MALLSEVDRKLIMGKDWKPLPPPDPNEKRNYGAKLVAVAVVLAAIAGYWYVYSARVAKVAADAQPVTTVMTAAPAVAVNVR